MRRPFTWQLYLAVSLPIVLALNVFTYLASPDSPAAPLLDSLATIFAFGFAISAVALSLRAFTSFAERAGWAIIGVAILFFGIGDLVWIHLKRIGETPFPSPADWCYLSFYLLVVMGLFLQQHFRQSPGFSRAILLIDMTVVLLSALSLTWLWLVSPLLRNNPELSVTGQALIVTYPTLDAVILLCLVALQYHSGMKAWLAPRLILGAGAVLLTAADILFAAEFHAGSLQTSGLVDSLWAIAFLLFGASALAHARQAGRSVEADSIALPSRWRQLMLFLLVTGAGIVVLVLFLAPGTRSIPEKGLLVGTMLVVFLVMIRQWLIFEENRRLYRELRDAYQEVIHLAHTDPITMLHNYRYFVERLEEEVERAKRYDTPLALIFADVDFFKQINDTYGHRVGDLVLREVGVLLQQHLRTTDILARYAGEEFVVLLPQTTLEQAGVLAERLRRGLATTEISVEHGRPILLTASFGISAFPVPSNNLESLLADADSAMYQVKRDGRNNVYVAREDENLYLPFP